MATHLLSMNGKDFTRFMEKPEAITSVIEEYHAIVPNFKEKLQNDSKSEPKCGAQLSRYLHRRVKLSGHKIFIDASILTCDNANRTYMCAKVPSDDAHGKFWQSVWEHKVQIIVLMCQVAGNAGYQHWPLEEGCVMVCDKFEIKTLKIEVNRHWNVTLMGLRDQSGQERNILHYQYTAWPWDDFSHDVHVLIDFYCNVKDMCAKLDGQALGKNRPPIVVQCLDGVGSSAVFCVLDICVAQLEKTGTLSLGSVLKRLRQQKYGFMNRIHHYVLCYELVNLYLKNKLCDTV